MLQRKLRMGMIGGGPGSFIGAIHRMAARLDGEIELVCGAFSSEPKKSTETGEQLYLPPDRIYGSYKEMLEKEAKLDENKKMDLVRIVTPNHLHFEPAKLALQNGFHVVLDKPMTFDLAQAKELKNIVTDSGKLLCVTYTYTGYPMVKEARQQVLSKKFGAITKVYVEYPQGWLSNKIEDGGQKQAAWRTDPSKSGIAGTMGDIGVHAFNLAEYVTGLQVTEICADINTVVDKRRLDDDGSVLLKFNNGATGALIATQVAAGEENNIKIRVYGEKGGIEWQQNDANSLVIKWLDKPAEIWRAGNDYLSAAAKQNSRTPSGHPEGWIEAFANLYRNFAWDIKAGLGKEKTNLHSDFPDVEQGYRGMLFIEKAIESGKSSAKWLGM
jgi:predicted dehydrogenase